MINLRSVGRIILIGLALVVGIGVIAQGVAATPGQQVNVTPSDLIGSGTQIDPFKITNASELQSIEHNLSATYILDSDINASGTKTWNNGKGFDPIGINRSIGFTGTFDGENHTITGLSINRTNLTTFVGPFGVITSNGAVRDVHLNQTDIDGGYIVGGIAGENNGGIIRNVSVSGTVSGVDYIGGVAGISQNKPYQSDGVVVQATSSVRVNGSLNVGGLVGFNDGGTLAHGKAHGNVTGDRYVGVLTGRNLGILEAVAATGRVRGTREVGGLVGSNDGTIRDAAANVTVEGAYLTGGFAGENLGVIRNASAAGNVTEISNPGGATGSTGGLVGANSGAGNKRGVIEGVSVTSHVNGSRTVGILAGGNFDGATIRRATADGSVTGSGLIGGLVGYNRNSDIYNTSATASVTGTDKVGGLVGYSSGKIQDSYSAATVSGSTATDAFVGSTSTSTVLDAYWDSSRAGQVGTQTNATGLATSQMTGQTAQSAMADLSFGTVWKTQANDYPAVNWRVNTKTVGDAADIANTAPAAAFTFVPKSPDAGATVRFNASNSTDLDGSIDSYVWDLDGDGRTDATGDVVTYVYQRAGTYDPKLTVTDNSNATQNASMNIQVMQNASYTPPSPGDLTGNGQAATDPDTDGVFEDVNGDGSADLRDLRPFFNIVRPSGTGVNNPSYLDLNGDGRANLRDLRPFFNEIKP